MRRTWSFACIFVLLFLAGCSTTLSEKIKANGNLFKHSTEFAVENFNIDVEVFLSPVLPAPTIVHAHGCSGWDIYERNKAIMMSSWGYNVVAPKATKSRGFYDGKNLTCTKGWYVYPPSERVSDLNFVAKWVNQQTWHKGKIGMIGFSQGGGAVEHALFDDASDEIWAGLISFYPNCRVDVAKDGKLIPHQFHIPDKDENFDRCLVRNKNNQRNYFIYENSTHSFDNNWAGPNANGYVFNPTATKLAFERVRQFFSENLK